MDKQKKKYNNDNNKSYDDLIRIFASIVKHLSFLRSSGATKERMNK